ncbi:MAG: transglutaminase [Bacteroidetes bacterium]|nr:MAG: transglutaminase [Bacteroidota bacterium]
MQKLFITLLVVVAGFHAAWAWPGEVIKTLKAPAFNSTGIAFDGKNLWVADRKSDLIYCVDPTSGAIIRSIEAPAYWPSALAWNGSHLLSIDTKGGVPLSENYNATIYKIDPSNGHIVHFTAAPSANTSGVESDKGRLWSISPRESKVVMVNATDGTTIRSFPAPTRSSSALAYDGTYLWIVDPYNDKLFMVSPDDGTVIITTETPSPYVRDIAFDGTNLWLADSQTDSLYLVKTRDEHKYRLTNKRELYLNFTHFTTNFGPGKTTSLDVHIAIPEDRVNQKIIAKTRFEPAGYEIFNDRWNQKTAHWHVTDLQSGAHFEANMYVRADTWDITYFLFPDQVGSQRDIPEEIKTLYLADNEKFQLNNPIISNAVKEALGTEENLYYKARKLYRYVREHIYYEMVGGWNTAPEVLSRGNGSCSEYSFVYIALCRAAGIPARYVGAVSVRSDQARYDDVFHRWVEIYLPNYGWIPVDPSGGDSDSPAHQAAYFGAIKGRYIITTQSGGGSESLEWTYNANEFTQTEPKTFVVSESIGNWDVVK